MRYRAEKPFGRRRTDQSLSPEERDHLQLIRQDVENDESGMIRRYLRLSEKLLNIKDDDEGEPESERAKGNAA
jgi:hypothetical protein